MKDETFEKDNGHYSPVPGMASGWRPPCWREGGGVPTAAAGRTAHQPENCDGDGGSRKGARRLPPAAHCTSTNNNVQLSDLKNQPEESNV